MTKPAELIKRAFIGLMVCLQVVFYPAAAFAQTSDDTSSSELAPAPDGEAVPPPISTNSGSTENGGTASTAVTSNDGAGVQTEAATESTAPAYTQNADGTWTNGTYTWNPETKQAAPNAPQEYSYNPETKMWDTVEYAYDPATGKYVPNVKSVAQKPSSGNPVSLMTSPNGTAAALQGVNGTGPGSTNLIGANSTNNGFFAGFFNARISNTINSSAHSGDASVIQNTLGGNALSGDAAVLISLLNLLQSSWDPSMGDFNTFVANIDGDVNGDIMIDPSVRTANTGPGSVNAADSNSTNNLQVVVDNDGTIDNELNVDASSGEATVSGNTVGGDARSGNVSVIINLINLINSYINSGNSFFGVLNINGNLNGDILLAPWLLEGLIANTGPDSTNSANQTVNNNLDVSVSDTQTINNDVNAEATTGSANVSGNTQGGSSTSGQASTNITLLNLTGRKIIGKNALLVFVNVFGKWVGLIMDAPVGTNSALLTDTGPGSSNSANTSQTNNADINVASRNTINNDVNVNAASGDANVTGNTQGGDAESGDANIGINISNIINSEFRLSDWFGVLFINVFGSWTGSFGVNTAAGDPPAAAQTNSASASAPAAVSTAASSGGNGGMGSNGVFGFIPRLASNMNGAGGSTVDSAVTAQTGDQVLGDSEAMSGFSTQSAGGGGSESVSGSQGNWWVIAMGMLSGLLLLGGERVAPLLRRVTRKVSA